MLPELVLYALSPTKLSHHRAGLAAKAVSLWSRAFRCRKAWAEHEARCHAIVESAIEALPLRRKVVVLGSGLMRDVPLSYLAARFSEVVLVDAVHLLPIRLRALRHRNVRLVTADLSGALAWLAGTASQRVNPLPDLCGDAGVDLVISANLASQLGLGLAGWVARSPARVARLGMDPDALPTAAAGWHIDDLAGLNCRVCLLSDTAYGERPADGSAEQTWPLIPMERLPQPDAVWDWVVAPLGEESPNYSRVHTAAGWMNLATGRATQKKTALVRGLEGGSRTQDAT